MTGPEVGPSMASLVEQAAAALDNAARPLLAQAVRLLAERNTDLAVDAEQLQSASADATQAAQTWAVVHRQAEEAGETYARMYRLEAENAEHYRGALRRIANATDIDTARQIAAEALK